jgi:hypothetical protein
MDTGCSFTGDKGNQGMKVTYINIDVKNAWISVSMLALHIHVVVCRYK